MSCREPAGADRARSRGPNETSTTRLSASKLNASGGSTRRLNGARPFARRGRFFGFTRHPISVALGKGWARTRRYDDPSNDPGRQQLKHPLAPRDGSGAYFAEMAKAARLNSNDLAPSQLMSCTTAIRQEGAQRLIFHQPLRFGVRTPCDQVQASSGLSESCPKNADVPKSPFPCSGSPGAVGRHNNT
jgi:hypothetical protein